MTPEAFFGAGRRATRVGAPRLVDATHVKEIVFILALHRSAWHQARVHDEHVVLWQLHPKGHRFDLFPALFIDSSREVGQMIRGRFGVPAVAPLQEPRFMIASDGDRTDLACDREHLAAGRPFRDKISDQDDGVPVDHRKAVEKISKFARATVDVADDEGSTHTRTFARFGMTTTPPSLTKNRSRSFSRS